VKRLWSLLTQEIKDMLVKSREKKEKVKEFVKHLDSNYVLWGDSSEGDEDEEVNAAVVDEEVVQGPGGEVGREYRVPDTEENEVEFGRVYQTQQEVGALVGREYRVPIRIEDESNVEVHQTQHISGGDYEEARVHSRGEDEGGLEIMHQSDGRERDKGGRRGRTDHR